MNILSWTRKTYLAAGSGEHGAIHQVLSMLPLAIAADYERFIADAVTVACWRRGVQRTVSKAEAASAAQAPS